jgi:hypothetical protein
MIRDEAYRESRFWQVVHAMCLPWLAIYRRDCGVRFLRGGSPAGPGMAAYGLVLVLFFWATVLSLLSFSPFALIFKFVLLVVYTGRCIAATARFYNKRGAKIDDSGISLFEAFGVSERASRFVAEPGVTFALGAAGLLLSWFFGAGLMFTALVLLFKEWHVFATPLNRQAGGEAELDRHRDDSGYLTPGIERREAPRASTRGAAARPTLKPFTDFEGGAESLRAPMQRVTLEPEPRPAALRGARRAEALPAEAVSTMPRHALPPAEREREYARILGLAPWPQFDRAELERCYHRELHAHHPDHHANDPARCEAATEHTAWLTAARKYFVDRLGEAERQGGR